MVWPTRGSRTAKEQNRALLTPRLRVGHQADHARVIKASIIIIVPGVLLQ